MNDELWETSTGVIVLRHVTKVFHTRHAKYHGVEADAWIMFEFVDGRSQAVSYSDHAQALRDFDKLKKALVRVHRSENAIQMAVLEQRVNALWFAPGMPGAQAAAATFGQAAAK